MSIPYRLTPLRDNISKSPKTGYYAQIVTKGTVDPPSLCHEIAAGCTLTVADLRAAIEAISSSVASCLMNGYNVNIDGLGTFSLSAESKVVEGEDELRSPSVKVKNVNFRSAVSLKKAVKNSSFERIKK